MWTPGPFELIIIMVIVVLLFGTSKIAGLGGSVGTAIREFKEAVKAPEEQPSEPTEENTEKPSE